MNLKDRSVEPCWLRFGPKKKCNTLIYNNAYTNSDAKQDNSSLCYSQFTYDKNLVSLIDAHILIYIIHS